MKRYIVTLILSIWTVAQLAAQISWEQVAPGVWKGVVGTPESYSLLQVADVTPKMEGFSRLPEVMLPAFASEIKGNIQDGQTALRILLQ